MPPPAVTDPVTALLDRSPHALTRIEQRQLVAGVRAEHWESHPDALLEHTEHLVNASRHRDALDLLRSADPSNRRVAQLEAWALRASGAPQAAAARLASLRRRGEDDEETLGFSGSVEKDLARVSSSAEEAADHSARAHRFYADAFARFRNYWCGINAATLSVAEGRLEEARQLAAQVAAACTQEIERGDGLYYTWATLGQARLILGSRADAEEAYRRAAATPDATLAKIGRDKRQAAQLLDQLQMPAGLVDAVLPTAEVIVFAGNRADAGRRQRGLDATPAGALATALGEIVRRRAPVIGYAAAADGADIVFHEALAAAGGESHVVLPTDVASFRAVSVATDWRERFDAVLERADSLTVTGDGIDPTDPADLDYAGRVTLGMARMKAQELAAGVSGLAVWDGSNGGAGGTASSVSMWQHNRLPITVIHPRTLEETAERAVVEEIPAGTRTIKAMLCADVVGYSALSDREVGDYFSRLLPRVATACRKFGPLVQDTFGDAFYFVFEEIDDATRAALALRSVFRDSTLNIRIALHAGPLLECYDPIQEVVNFTGRHASRAARVEPVVDENQVLATQQFAALSALQAPGEFEFVYAGERVLPKGYGTERLYVVTRR